MKKVRVVIQKIIDDVIIRRRQAVNLNNVQHALFKNTVDLFQDFSQKLIHTYNFIEFVPNIIPILCRAILQRNLGLRN
jgi:hypothetical protein